MNNWREFRFIRKGKKDLVWMIKQDGKMYHTRHGQLDGAMQDNSDCPGSKGKEDTKAFVSEEDNCSFHISREVRKKTESGYIEYVNGVPTSEQVSELKFNDFLPKAFTAYKPQTSITDNALVKLDKVGSARYTRKYDGMAHLAVHHSWGWEIYSRRIDLASDRFPHHLRVLSECDKFGIGTIIVGEMVCLKENKRDDFKAISRVCRSDPPDARKLIHDNEVPEPTFIIFDVLFHNGKDLQNESYDERSELWKFDFPYLMDRKDEFICSVDYFDLSQVTWEKRAKEEGWEGFVVVDGKSVPGDKFYSFNGKAKRPKGSFKLKPLFEDDVVIYAGLLGGGKRLGGVGSVFVKQLHPDTGKWFNCGKVGSGFTESDLEEIETLIKNNNLPIVEKDKDVESLDLSDSDNGIVAMIEFSERQPGSNKFRFPVFNRVRFDKAINECVAQKLAEEEESDN